MAPGLVGTVFDGIQRPLELLRSLTGAFIKPVQGVSPLPREKKWPFKPTAKVGAKLVGGDVLGTVTETALIEHRVLVPPAMQGNWLILCRKATIQLQTPSPHSKLDGAKTDAADDAEVACEKTKTSQLEGFPRLFP